MQTTGNDPFKTAFMLNAVLNVPFSVTATLANTLVIVSIRRTYALNTPPNMLLIGLALSDLCVGLVVQPFYIAFLVSFAKHGANNFTCMSSVCVVLAGTFVSCVSFGTVTAISIERYIALRLHLRYEALITPERIRTFLLSLWLIGFVLPFVWVWLAPSYKSHFLITGTLFCLVVSSVAYIKIYRVVRIHVKQIRSQEVQLETEDMGRHETSPYSTFLVYFALLCCYIPYSISLAYGKVLGYSRCNWIAINFALTVVNINSSINPFIYCYRMRDIRQAMLLTLYASILRRRVHN